MLTIWTYQLSHELFQLIHWVACILWKLLKRIIISNQKTCVLPISYHQTFECLPTITLFKKSYIYLRIKYGSHPLCKYIRPAHIFRALCKILKRLNDWNGCYGRKGFRDISVWDEVLVNIPLFRHPKPPPHLHPTHVRGTLAFHAILLLCMEAKWLLFLISLKPDSDKDTLPKPLIYQT